MKELLESPRTSSFLITTFPGTMEPWPSPMQEGYAQMSLNPGNKKGSSRFPRARRTASGTGRPGTSARSDHEGGLPARTGPGPEPLIGFMEGLEKSDERPLWTPRLSAAFRDFIIGRRKEDGGRRWSERTMNRVIAHLKPFAKWVHALQAVPLGNPMARIRGDPVTNASRSSGP